MEITHRDMHGAPVKVGDRIQAPGYPMFAVRVNGLVNCEATCQNGAAAISDPETGEYDEVCLSSMELAAGSAPLTGPERTP